MKKDSLDNKISAIDGLKGIAACVVAFCWHYQHFNPESGTPFSGVIPTPFKYGWMMVEVFFVLSGFGMMLGYYERISGANLDFISFIKKRLIKFYPTFLLGTALIIPLQILYIHKAGEPFVYPFFDLYHFIANLLLIQNGYLGNEWSFDSPSWCICMCVLCYIIFYALIKRLKTKMNVYYASAILFVIGLAMTLKQGDGPLFNLLTGRALASFFIGVLIFGIYEKRESFAYKRLGYIFLVLLAVTYIVMRFFPDYLGYERMAAILVVAPVTIIPPLFIPWFGKLIGNKLFASIGSISLEIYIFHFPVQCLIKDLDAYFSLGLNYSTKSVMLIYIGNVLIFATLYKLFVKERFDTFCSKFFVKK